ncbi:arsenate reductase (glutaredoxin) [Methylomarinovum caldicuralii]|uniref:Arsenate reductase n=1 Tax=Methylomarinovum caldicuralii TaxID=438856 RepID=A0AAU9BV56_9GAMM|nr:arsenate reductase (glutaredoxin) [Methylomarinovum caldicuralii]BCX82863.1 arsenate reductase (glutaredoxin) [Methylomarinovum caldicuralii]
MDVVIYHNPRCSKSRATLALLREHGIEPRIVEYLKQPPSREELEAILDKLGFSDPRRLMRTKEKVYKELQLDAPDADRDRLLEAMLANPILIERPIVVAGRKAAIGRPPENVLEILPS